MKTFIALAILLSTGPTTAASLNRNDLKLECKSTEIGWLATEVGFSLGLNLEPVEHVNGDSNYRMIPEIDTDHGRNMTLIHSEKYQCVTFYVPYSAFGDDAVGTAYTLQAEFTNCSHKTVKSKTMICILGETK